MWSVSGRSPTFASETVTIRPVHRLNIHQTYHLRVIVAGPHGLIGTDGCLLNGSGQSGTNYHAMINLRVPRSCPRS